MNGLRQEWGEEVYVVQVDIHRAPNRQLIRRLDAQFTPTFVLLDQGGEIAWRQVGTLNAAEAHRQVALLVGDDVGESPDDPERPPTA